MDVTIPTLSRFAAAALTAVPLLAIVGAALAQRSMPRGPAPGWSIAGRVATAALATALLALGLVVAGRLAGSPLSGNAFVRVDTAGTIMLTLVAFVGWVIVRYSRRYLAGDRGEARYVPALLATIGAVGVVVATNHLVVLALAWLATSLSLHRLLTFYDERPAALIAAHKKFIASRAADLALFAAVGLVGHAWGTFQIDVLAARAAAAPELPLAIEVAAVLFALTAILKCAQLPVHGWLIQVMEAPTPVSALLHAGIVNLGGFVLIRLADLTAASTAAQVLLVVVGGLTAALAALVAGTRISIKVALAWSTCAQMGFMLMQCGLGLPALALLHIVAHSLYKAHSFLSAGGAVEQARIQLMAGRRPAPSPLAAYAAAAVGALAVAAAAWTLGADYVGEPGVLVLALIASLALAPLALPRGARTIGALLRIPLVVIGLAVLYIGLHDVAGLAFDVVTATRTGISLALSIGVGLVFLTVFAVQVAIAADPRGALAQRLHHWFYAGFYLDEIFTRLTFRVWPAQLRRATAPTNLAAAPVAAGDAR
jgi:NAD(P)H-quinone oxidoreductase subunit 5